METCFDKLNLEECIKDLYDTGLDNDKLVLLYLENKNCQVAVKSSAGITKQRHCMVRIDVHDSNG